MTKTKKPAAGVRAVTVTTAVIGGFALVGAGTTAAFAAVDNMVGGGRSEEIRTVDAEGIESIDLDMDAGFVRVEFGDVAEAELAVADEQSGDWRMWREGDQLIVRSPESGWGWWFSRWFDDTKETVLTLPSRLQSAELDADLTLDAGSLDVQGRFGSLSADVGAGSFEADVAATSLDVDMSAGRSDLVVDGAADVELDVSAGAMDVDLTGDPPSNVEIDVSAGSLDLTAPDVAYTVTRTVSAGTLDVQVDTVATSSHTIEVGLSAGSATIRPAESER